MKPTYEATATIELNKSGGGSMDLGLGDALGQQLASGADLQTDLATETAILKGDSLALAVIQKLKLAAQPPFANRKRKVPPSRHCLLMNRPRHGRGCWEFSGSI